MDRPYVQIKLPCGAVTKIDKCDEYLRKEFPSWWANCKDSHVVVARYLRRENGRDVYDRIYLHRAILKPPKEMVVDHINRNPLDNRRCNLRIVTYQQNSFNHKKTKDTSSKYMGVCFDRGRWKASLSILKRLTHLGYFDCEEDAAREHDRAARRTRGKFASLNFP